MSATEAQVAALDADVLFDTGEPPADRTPAQQTYLDRVADDAEAAVDAVQQTIDDLTASLADRKVEAQRARAEANEAQVSA